MIQGTTPTITLNLPMDADKVVKAEYVLCDCKKKIIRTWHLDDMVAQGRQLIIKLSEQDTLDLAPGLWYGQLRVQMDNDEITASDLMPFYMKKLMSQALIE